jgi:hypothetical protein
MRGPRERALFFVAHRPLVLPGWFCGRALDQHCLLKLLTTYRCSQNRVKGVFCGGSVPSAKKAGRDTGATARAFTIMYGSQ